MVENRLTRAVYAIESLVCVFVLKSIKFTKEGKR